MAARRSVPRDVPSAATPFAASVARADSTARNSASSTAVAPSALRALATVAASSPLLPSQEESFPAASEPQRAARTSAQLLRATESKSVEQQLSHPFNPLPHTPANDQFWASYGAHEIRYHHHHGDVRLLYKNHDHHAELGYEHRGDHHHHRHDGDRHHGRARETDAAPGALGTGDPRLAFGHTCSTAENTSGTVALTFHSEWCDLLNYFQPVSNTPQSNAWDGIAFSMVYNKAAGLRIVAGSPTASTSPITKNPLTPPATPDDVVNVGFYDLHLANNFYDGIFKFFHVQRVSATIRLVPIVPLTVTPSTAITSGISGMGTFSVRPWFGEPYICQDLTDGTIIPDNVDDNYLSRRHPARIVQWPRPGEEPKEFDVGFLPVMPTVSTGTPPPSSLLALYQTISPVDTIRWAAGTADQNAYLGWALVMSPALVSGLFGNEGGPTYRVQVRFSVQVRWWDLLPPLLFQVSTPRPSSEELKLWADKVLAADQALLMQVAEDIAGANAQLAAPSVETPQSAALRAGVESARLCDSVQAMSTDD